MYVPILLVFERCELDFLVSQILILVLFPTMIIIVIAAEYNKDKTYHDVIFSMCGKRLQQLAALSILLSCYGIGIAFLIVIGDQFDRSKDL